MAYMMGITMILSIDLICNEDQKDQYDEFHCRKATGKFLALVIVFCRRF